MRRRADRLAVLLIGIALFAGGSAHAARRPQHFVRHRVAAPAPAPISASILVDVSDGRVLSESNADAVTYPASLTKLMTLFLTFKALDEGHLTLDTRLPVSAYAASQQPTKLGLRVGDTVSVRNLILGIVTHSANDAAVVLAEGLGGSQAGFVKQMNAEARALGMNHTHYENASGLPMPGVNLTTARDEAQLAIALYHDFPREFHYFATREFDFRGREYVSFDHLLGRYPGVDGMKTGYINASGFNLVTSAMRDGHRLMGVVLGGRTGASRDRQMEAMLTSGFAELGVGQVMVAQRKPLNKVQPQPKPVLVAAAARVAVARKPGPIARTAAKIAAHLLPVARAEAAPVAKRMIDVRRLADARRPAVAIQIGAFRMEAAARKAALEARRLRVARGKPLLILRPSKAEREPFYRARLLSFTLRSAETACAELHRKRIACAVVASR